MHRLSLLLLILCGTLFSCHRGEEEATLPRFDRLTTADGLQSDHVLHILQLPDRRMAITSDSCVNLYDGSSVVKHPVRPHEVYPIPGYTGAYHVYADRDGGLWVKEWGRVWRMDLQTGNYTDLSDIPMRDIFVDSRHERWLVGDSVVQDEGEHAFRLPTLPIMPRSATDPAERDSLQRRPALQDLDADSLRLFLFYSNGAVVCYDRRDGSQRYIVQAYDSTEMRAYDGTSLVVRSTADGQFYQLRCGRQRHIFLQFNPETQTWRTLFETKTGTFHSLVITADGRLALLGCPQGVWEINLDNGQMRLHSELLTTAGDTLRTGVNGLVCDRDGGLWLATYDYGVLHAPTLHASRAYLIYIVAAALAVIALIIGLAFWLYALRMRRHERRLMQRLRELSSTRLSTEPKQGGTDPFPGPPQGEGTYTFPSEEVVTTPSPWGGHGEGAAPLGEGQESSPEPSGSGEILIQQAVALVRQNLNTPGYGVEQLAADLCMERTGLYKKLTAALDQTPTLFMRNIRMEQAARLLREGRLSVAEIAEQCGFQSPGYFSRLFQQTYGMKPSEYARSQA